MSLTWEFHNEQLIIELLEIDSEGRGSVVSSIYIPLSELKKELEKVE